MKNEILSFPVDGTGERQILHVPFPVEKVKQFTQTRKWQKLEEKRGERIEKWDKIITQ